MRYYIFLYMLKNLATPNLFHLCEKGLPFLQQTLDATVQEHLR